MKAIELFDYGGFAVVVDDPWDDDLNQVYDSASAVHFFDCKEDAKERAEELEKKGISCVLLETREILRFRRNGGSNPRRRSTD